MPRIFTEVYNLFCATLTAMLLPLGSISSGLLFCYILFTNFHWILLFYVLWVLMVDWKVERKGGRTRNKYLSTIYNGAGKYFPVKLETAADFTLDPEKNYILCAFPHGYIALGMQILCNSTLLISELFKNHRRYLATLDINFYIPFYRELMLVLGFVSVSATSLKHILCRPSRGNVIVLLPGGVQEVFFCNSHKKYIFFLKNRKGFVKLALLTGSPLIPTICFGENNIYNIVDNYFFYKFAKLFKKLLGFGFIIPIGKWYTLIPIKNKITILGIDVD